MTISIINGPNLNNLGKRDPQTYGAATFEETLEKLREQFPGIELEYFQSNSEGDIIDKIQEVNLSSRSSGIILNPGAYSHYSYAIADAVADSRVPVVEVHISNIHAREEFRAKSVTARSAEAIIAGCGRKGYKLAIDYLLSAES